MSADKNMTGEQIQQIMDMLLYKALEPLILYTNVFDAQVEYLLILIATNRKRKLSSLDRSVVVEKLAAYLSVSDRRQKYECIREARIERYFIHGFIKKFVDSNMWFLADYNAFLENPSKDQQIDLDTAATAIGMCSRFKLYTTINLAQSYIARFYAYRNTIVGHYVKKSSKVAKAHVNSSKAQTDYKDLVQSVLKSIITALDKYDSRKGALTSYIATWSKNAVTTTKEHEYGVAYTIPQTQRKKVAEGISHDVNYGVSLDALYSDEDEDGAMALHSVLAPARPMDEDLEREETISIVQRLAKRVDPTGIARLSLDIGEYFTTLDHSIMQQQMAEEGLA